MSESTQVIESCGNVFADLGVTDPETALLKSDLAIKIKRTIAQLGLSQEQAAARMHLRQPKVSAIVRGRLEGFSVDRLLRCLRDLNLSVTIVVGPPADVPAMTVAEGRRRYRIHNIRTGRRQAPVAPPLKGRKRPPAQQQSIERV